jgi:hypothetical protein
LVEKKETSVPCTISGRTITFQISSVDIGTLILGIRDVQNPDTVGGLGNFKLFTYWKSILKDKNEVYPSVGLGTKPSEVTSPKVEIEGLG